MPHLESAFLNIGFCIWNVSPLTKPFLLYVCPLRVKTNITSQDIGTFTQFDVQMKKTELKHILCQMMSGHGSMLDATVLYRHVVVLPEALLRGPPCLLRQQLKPPQEHNEGHEQGCLHHHEHKQSHLRGQGQVTVPVVTGLQELLLC